MVDTFSQGNQAIIDEETIEQWVDQNIPLEKKYSHGFNIQELLQLNYPVCINSWFIHKKIYACNLIKNSSYYVKYFIYIYVTYRSIISVKSCLSI